MSRGNLGYERQILPQDRGLNFNRPGFSGVAKSILYWQNKVMRNSIRNSSLIILGALLSALISWNSWAQGSGAYNFTGVVDEISDGWAVLISDTGQKIYLPAESIYAAKEGAVFTVTIDLTRDKTEEERRLADNAALLGLLLE